MWPGVICSMYWRGSYRPKVLSQAWHWLQHWVCEEYTLVMCRSPRYRPWHDWWRRWEWLMVEWPAGLLVTRWGLHLRGDRGHVCVWLCTKLVYGFFELVDLVGQEFLLKFVHMC